MQSFPGISNIQSPSLASNTTINMFSDVTPLGAGNYTLCPFSANGSGYSVDYQWDFTVTAVPEPTEFAFILTATVA